MVNDYRDRVNQERAGRKSTLQNLAEAVTNNALYRSSYNVPDPVAMNPAMYALGAATPPEGGVMRLRQRSDQGDFGARAGGGEPGVSRYSNIDPLAYASSGYEDRPSANAPRAPSAALTPQQRAELAVRYRQLNQQAADAAGGGDRSLAAELRAERDALGRAGVAASTYDNLNRSRTLPMSERTIKLDGSYDNAEMYGGATAPNQDRIAQRLIETGLGYGAEMDKADRLAKLRAERTQFADQMTGAGRDAALAGIRASGKVADAQGRSADTVMDSTAQKVREAMAGQEVAKAGAGTAAANTDKTKSELEAATLPTVGEVGAAKAMRKSGLGTPEEQAAFVQSFTDAINVADNALLDNNDNNTKARTRMAVMLSTLEELAKSDPESAKKIASQVAAQLGSEKPGYGAMDYLPVFNWPALFGGGGDVLTTGGGLAEAKGVGGRSRTLGSDVRSRLKKLSGI